MIRHDGRQRTDSGLGSSFRLVYPLHSLYKLKTFDMAAMVVWIFNKISMPWKSYYEITYIHKIRPLGLVSIDQPSYERLAREGVAKRVRVPVMVVLRLGTLHTLYLALTMPLFRAAERKLGLVVFLVDFGATPNTRVGRASFSASPGVVAGIWSS
jgi:hypothetical protein